MLVLLTQENNNNNMVSQQGAKRQFSTPKLDQNIIISQKINLKCLQTNENYIQTGLYGKVGHI